MRLVCCVLAILVSLSGMASVQAVTVSPVVVERYQIQQADELLLTLSNPNLEPQTITLNWGWFTQNSDGSLALLDSKQDHTEVSQVLHIPKHQYTLVGQQTINIPVTVRTTDFQSISPVLFISLSDGQMHGRLAVLFLLSTLPPQQSLLVEDIQWNQQQLEIYVSNPEPVHQSFQALVSEYHNDAVIKQSSLASLRILANSDRVINCALESETDLVILFATGLPDGKVELHR